MIVLAALFVLSGALIKTGVMESFGGAIYRLAGTSRTRVLLLQGDAERFADLGNSLDVALAASISYVTPFEPSCLLVYGPGKYRFRDFLIAGTPLSLLLLIVLTLLAPRLWPLR